MGRGLLFVIFLSLPCLVWAQDDEEEYRDTVITEIASDSTIALAPDDYEQEAPKPVAPELRVVPDSLVNNLKQTDTFAYANDPAYWNKTAEEEPQESSSFWEHFYAFFSGSTVRTITYIILGVILVLIIYRIIVVNNLFMTPASRRRRDATDDLVDDIEDNNLEAKIQDAIRERNYRAATRFMYLQALRFLQEKGWIHYHARGTNHEYLSQVQPYGVGKEFRFLTHVYEYVWYGEFALSEDQFNRVYQNFQQFYNAVKP